MNKKILKISIAVIIVGAMLLYMSFEGASGFGLSLTSHAGLPTSEDFNDLADWEQPTGENAGIINPSGQLEFISTSPTLRMGEVSKNLGNIVNDVYPNSSYTTKAFVVTYYMSISLDTAVSPRAEVDLDNYINQPVSQWWCLTINDSGVYSPWAGTYPSQKYLWPGGHNPDANFHTYVTAFTLASGQYWSFTVSRDGVSLWSAVAQSVGDNGPRFCIDTFYALRVHVDWITVTNTGSLPPQTGSINAYCTLDGSAKSGVTISDGSRSATTGGDGRATISSVPYGTYSVTATLSGYAQQTHTGIGVSSSNPSADAGTFAFTSTPGTGSIYVDAQDQAGTAIRNTLCFVTVGGVASADAPHTFPSVAYGTYTVSATWKGEYQYVQVSVSSGNPNPTATLHFSNNLDSGPWDPLAGLRTFLNSITVRQYELYAGAMAVLLGSILFPVALFVKKKTVLPLVG